MALGAVFIYFAATLLRTADRRWALRTYLFSLAYLALLFLSMRPRPRVLGSRARSRVGLIEIRPWIARPQGAT